MNILNSCYYSGSDQPRPIQLDLDKAMTEPGKTSYVWCVCVYVCVRESKTNNVLFVHHFNNLIEKYI